MSELSIFEGKIIQVTTKRVEIDGEEKLFEIPRRSPGVRIIVEDGDKLLITKEYREELKKYDYRLPGGKVFASLQSFLNCDEEKLEFLSKQAAIKECLEETGYEIKNPKLIKISKCGATIKWDLYYFIANEYIKKAQKLEMGEKIEPVWITKQELKKLILKGEFSEDRSIAVLFSVYFG